MSANGRPSAGHGAGHPVDLATRRAHPPSVLPGIAIPPELLEAIAALVAARVVDALDQASEPWMNAKSAAAYIDAPVSRINSWVETGRVRCFRDGKRLLFRRTDLDDVLEEDERRA